MATFAALGETVQTEIMHSPAEAPRNDLPLEQTLNEPQPMSEDASFAPHEQGSYVRVKPRVVSREEVLLELCHLL